MSRLERHPETGFHYIHVIPNNWGAFVDVFACHEHAARSLPWLSVIPPYDLVDNQHWDNEHVFFIYWMNWETRENRRARVALVYSEALDDNPALMLPAHQRHWDKVLGMAESYDMFLGHTPEMAERLRRAGKPTGVLPVGWEPLVMGTPRRTEKIRRLVYHGSPAGRRALLMPYLFSVLSPEILYDASGQFGRGLVGALDTCRASLYIAHSGVRSWSTWRIWQALAAGCAIVGEPGDCWPLPPELLVTIDPITLENAEASVHRIRALAHEDDLLLRRGAQIYDLLGEKFTTTECQKTYLVEATRGLCR